MGRVGYSSVYLFPNTYVPLLIKLIIGQFDFVEGYYLSHPILTKSGRIGVNVHAAWHRRVCISRHYPLRTVISVSVDLRQHYYISQKKCSTFTLFDSENHHSSLHNYRVRPQERKNFPFKSTTTLYCSCILFLFLLLFKQ